MQTMLNAMHGQNGGSLAGHHHAYNRSATQTASFVSINRLTLAEQCILSQQHVKAVWQHCAGMHPAETPAMLNAMHTYLGFEGYAELEAWSSVLPY